MADIQTIKVGGTSYNIRDTSKLPLTGGTLTGGLTGTTATFSGTLTLTKATDASGTANNSPALIVGGAATSSHIEIDDNEIMAKNNGTTTGTLYLNSDGGDVQVNKVSIRNASILNAGTISWDRLPTSRIYDANTSRTKNTVLAAPNGSAGTASFRALVAADLPSHNHTVSQVTDISGGVCYNGTPKDSDYIQIIP